jgi:hypothetical protein
MQDEPSIFVNIDCTIYMFNGDITVKPDITLSRLQLYVLFVFSYYSAFKLADRF